MFEYEFSNANGDGTPVKFRRKPDNLIWGSSNNSCSGPHIRFIQAVVFNFFLNQVRTVAS